MYDLVVRPQKEQSHNNNSKLCNLRHYNCARLYRKKATERKHNKFDSTTKATVSISNKSLNTFWMPLEQDFRI
jgi:hypothetical protein